MSRFSGTLRLSQRAAACVAALFLSHASATAAPQHGIAMYGAPALPPDFVSLPHVNKDAPQGGTITFGETSGFDSLHPFILKGSSPYGWRVYGYESLMGRSWDEPFTLYGLIAESVETDDARSFVEFTLRESARFSDGSPITVEDVLWSFETLGTQGHPRYRNAWTKIASAEATGPRSVRFTFTEADRELPLILGLRPILQKAWFDDRAFDVSSMEPPIGSGPYVVAEAEAGRQLILQKDPDWWGADLPFNRGQHNFEQIRYEFFTDGTVAFEAFRAGETDSNREFNAAKWETDYDFPAMQSGEMVKSVIPHQRPSGITGFVMNTRRELFQDWRVREAMIQAFNFEFINAALNGGTQPRITSYFSNSVLAMQDGAASGQVAELLAPFAADLPPGTLEGYTLPVSNGSEANRRGIREALRLLQEAGYAVVDGVLTGPEGPVEITILLRSGATQTVNIAEIYAESLKRLGISVTLETVDSAQYKERTEVYDFDMAYYRRGLSLSPGNEQMLYWGRDGVETPGTRNWMGMDSPAAEAMISTMLTAEDGAAFQAAVRGLDRILTAGRYVVPIWHNPTSRIAHKARLAFPERIPMYGDWIGFQPDIWWSEE